MTTRIEAGNIPRLKNGFRFQWEPAQDSHVLLYPEGMVQLNSSAAAIIKQIDGERDVAEITERLQREFDVPDLIADVTEFLAEALARGWILVR